MVCLGIRIYDQLHVDTSFLPSYYSDTLIQIIKGVSHKFNGNRWITSIDTIAQPKVLFTEFNPNISHSPEGLRLMEPTHQMKVEQLPKM